MLQSPLREMRLGRLRAVQQIHLPYHLFEVKNIGRTTLLAIDALKGELDLHEIEREQVLDAIPMDALTVRLPAESAREALIDRVMRIVFLRGFFKRRGSAVEVTHAGGVHMPYWLGLFERRGRVQIEVIDAHRARFEGAKMRRLVGRIIEERAAASAMPALECNMTEVG